MLVLPEIDLKFGSKDQLDPLVCVVSRLSNADQAGHLGHTYTLLFDRSFN